MKNTKFFFGLFTLILALQSCSPVYQKEITKLNKLEWEPLELTPGYDFYFIRLDIIRNRETVNNNMNGPATTVDAPYHRLGFHLGNGLFYDLNDNLCLLVPKLYGLENDEPFSIEEQTSTRRTNRYTLSNNEFKTRYGGLLPQTDVLRISRDEEDGALILRNSALNKVRIYDSEEELMIKYALGKTKIRKEDKGYSVKEFLGRRDYIKLKSEVLLDNRYVIRERNNRIEIFSNKMFSKDKKLLFSMIKGDNKVIIYDRRNRGFKLEFKEDNELEFRRNKTLQAIYKM